MPSRVIRDPYQFDELVAFLGNLKLPLTVSWAKGADRSLEQNALMWVWAGEVADQLQDRDAADVQAEWKLTIGVPILRADDDDFRAKYDRTVRPLPHEQKIEIMRDFFPVTSLMKVRQMCRFMNLVEQRCAERGLKLSQPPADLAKYNARYGSMKPTPIAHHQQPEGVQGEHPQGELSERPSNAGKAGPGVPAAAGKRKDRKRLAAVAALPCCICTEYGMAQASPTQVHHCIHGRHSTSKAPDSMTIPLCEGHHQGLFDTSKLALHRAPATWRETYGADTEWLSWTEERL